jgi:hypothetical protein
MTKFEARENELYIDGKKVIRAWESWSGWYWFATEKVGEQMSLFPNGKEVPDTIWFGYVQGLEDEWGYFSQAEIEHLNPFAWEIPKKNLAYSGRRGS